MYSNVSEISIEVLAVNDPPEGATFNILTNEDEEISFDIPNVIDVDNNNVQNSQLNSNKDLEETSSDGNDAQKNLKTQKY